MYLTFFLNHPCRKLLYSKSQCWIFSDLSLALFFFPFRFVPLGFFIYLHEFNVCLWGRFPSFCLWFTPLPSILGWLSSTSNASSSNWTNDLLSVFSCSGCWSTIHPIAHARNLKSILSNSLHMYKKLSNRSEFKLLINVFMSYLFSPSPLAISSSSQCHLSLPLCHRPLSASHQTVLLPFPNACS